MKTNKQILMPIATSSPQDKGINDQLWGQEVKGQNHTRQIVDRFGGLTEASLWIVGE